MIYEYDDRVQLVSDVNNIEKGKKGRVISDAVEIYSCRWYLVEFDEKFNSGHNGRVSVFRVYTSATGKEGHCFWCLGKNLIPEQKG